MHRLALPTLLGFSLLLNLGLAAFRFSLPSSDPAAEAASHPAAEGPAPTAARTPAPRPDGLAPTDLQLWQRLPTEDLSALIAQLRAAGFPTEFIRAIVITRLHESFAARQRALQASAPQRPYWKNTPTDPQERRAVWAHSQQLQAELRRLLGPDAVASDPIATSLLRSRFGPLSPEKTRAAQAILDDFNRRTTEQYLTGGLVSMEDYRKQQAEMRQALTAVLSPAELEEYDFRNSNTGRALRQELSAFSPTEAEFRALYQLRSAFDERYSSPASGPQYQQQLQERAQAHAQLQEQIKNLLGPERYAEYQRSTDYQYRQTTQLVTRLELPESTALNLWNLRQDYTQRARSVATSGGALSYPERIAQLQQLQQQATAQAANLLGSSARVDAYKQYGGQWLTSLVPRARPPN